MLIDKFKLIISSTQDVDELHKFLFGDIDYYTIEEGKLLSWKDGKYNSLQNKILRYPNQVSPQTVTQINDFDNKVIPENSSVNDSETDMETI